MGVCVGLKADKDERGEVKEAPRVRLIVQTRLVAVRLALGEKGARLKRGGVLRASLTTILSSTGWVATPQLEGSDRIVLGPILKPCPEGDSREGEVKKHLESGLSCKLVSVLLVR